MKEFSSCLDPNPMVKLGGAESKASIINYNLPASTCFTVKNYVNLQIPQDFWSEEALQTPVKPAVVPQKDEPPAENRGSVFGFLLGWLGLDDRFATKPKYLPDSSPYEGIDEQLDEVAYTNPALGYLVDVDRRQRVQRMSAERVRSNPALTTTAPGYVAPDYVGQGNVSQSYVAQAYTKEAPIQPFLILSADAQAKEINEQAKRGRLPLTRKTLWGDYRVKNYVKMPFVSDPAPSGPQPSLVLIEQYEVCSYLGDYGAGKTIKTFSLLPGEKTTISIKTYKSQTDIKSKTENILDSFSENSSSELEAMVNEELGSSTSQQDAASSGFTSTENWNQSGGAKAGLTLPIFSASANLDLNHADTDVNTSTTNSARSNTVNSLRKGMDRHVAQSSATRKMDVNTETQQTSTTTSGEEMATTRELENINRSRVLNFVFRQLSQEYLTIVYLKDVSIGFTMGAIGDGQEVRLDGIDGLLNRVINTDEHRKEIKCRILAELCSVYDYDGTSHQFIEKINEVVGSCEDPTDGHTNVYYRKKKLKQSFQGKEVNGVILDVSTRILLTDALIVEALLGQGEALDCYNMRLQDAAVEKANLSNKERDLAIEVIQSIKDPLERARLYKRVFGDCCERGHDQNQEALKEPSNG